MGNPDAEALPARPPARTLSPEPHMLFLGLAPSGCAWLNPRSLATHRSLSHITSECKAALAITYPAAQQMDK